MAWNSTQAQIKMYAKTAANNTLATCSPILFFLSCIFADIIVSY
jgi:hypothetical protein